MKEHAKIQNKIATLMNEREQLHGAPAYSLEEHFQKAERAAKLDILLQIFSRVVAKLPADKRDAVHARLDEIYKGAVEPDYYEKIKQTYSPKTRDYYLFHKCPASVVSNNLMGQFVAEVSEYVDDKDLDEIADEIESYRPSHTNNNPVEYLRDKVEEQKKKNAATITDPEKLKALNDELEIVAQSVITSPKEYEETYGDPLSAIYGREINLKTDTLNNEMLQEEEYKHLQKYLKVHDNGRYGGVRNINESYAGDAQIVKDFQAENVRISVSENHKNTLKKIISLMRERGMLAFGGTGGEAATKTYGFAQIADAHDKLEAAIKGDDVEAIRAAREYYNTACANMREVFKIIEEEIKPNTEMLVDNVNSFREHWVPGEFKNSLPVNAYANAIYNLAMVLENNNFSLEEFCDNPNATAFQIFERAAVKATPDVRLKNQTFPEAIFDVMRHPLVRTKYPYLAVGRNIEFLTQLSVGTPEHRKNALGGMLIQSFDGFVLEMTQQGMLTSVEGYLSKNPECTLANMFLVNEEDRDYNKLRAFEAATADAMKKIPPFNTLDYLENHKLDPKVFTERVHATLAELAAPQTDGTGKKKPLDADELHRIVRASQLAAYEYLMVNPTPDAGLDKAGLKAYESLKTMIENPEKAFAAVMNKDLKNAINKVQSMKEFVAIASANGKNRLNKAREDARFADNVYTQTIEILKQTNGTKEEFDRVRQQEVERLKKAYVNGKLPKDYFVQRLQAVEAGEPEKVIPFGTAECPSFNEFKKQYAAELKAGELSKEDVKFFYDRMVETAKLEENKFILVSLGLQPNPTLEEDAPDVDEPAVQQEIEAERERIVVVEAMEAPANEANVKQLNDDLKVDKKPLNLTQG